MFGELAFFSKDLRKKAEAWWGRLMSVANRSSNFEAVMRIASSAGKRTRKKLFRPQHCLASELVGALNDPLKLEHIIDETNAAS